MIVHGVVQIAVADMAVAARIQGLARCAGAMPLPGLTADGPVPAPIRDVAQLLDVHVHQLTRGGALVAPHRPASGAVEVGQAGQTITGQHAMHRGGHQTKIGRDPGRPPASQHPDLNDAAMMRRSVRVGVRRGLECGREDRSAIPASPSAR
jgi:hypothetical protein